MEGTETMNGDTGFVLTLIVFLGAAVGIIWGLLP